MEVRTDEELRKCILEIVNKSTGIKGNDLALEIASKCHVDGKDYIELMNKLVEDGSIVEMELVLLQTPYRVKSIFFPKGTRLSLPVTR